MNEIDFSGPKQDVRYGTMPLYAIVDHHNHIQSWSGDREELEGCCSENERVVDVPAKEVKPKMCRSIAKKVTTLKQATHISLELGNVSVALILSPNKPSVIRWPSSNPQSNCLQDAWDMAHLLQYALETAAEHETECKRS